MTNRRRTREGGRDPLVSLRLLLVRAGQRVLATHEANLQRIEKEATTKTAGFLKAPLKLGGIVQAISSLAKSIEEEEAA